MGWQPAPFGCWVNPLPQLVYCYLSESYKHVVVPHKNGQYLRNGFDTNSIEGFWSLLKRDIYRIHHQVGPKHLQRYCDEFAARYNTGDILDNERFQNAVNNPEGSLKYNQLIGKKPLATFILWQKQKRQR